MEGAREIVRRRAGRQDADHRSHAQRFGQESDRAERLRTDMVEVAQHFVRHRLRHQGHEGVVVLAPPELFACFRQRAHQAGGRHAHESLAHDSIALVLDQAAQVGVGQRLAGVSRERNRHGMAARGGQREEIAVRRGPDARDRVGEVAGEIGEQRARRARPLGRAIEQLRDHGRVSSRHASAIPPEGRIIAVAASRAQLRLASQVSCVRSDAAGVDPGALTAPWDTEGRTG